MPITSATSKRNSMMAAAGNRRASNAAKRHSMLINPKDIPTSTGFNFDQDDEPHAEKAKAVKMSKSISPKQVTVHADSEQHKRMMAFSDQRAEFRRR